MAKDTFKKDVAIQAILYIAHHIDRKDIHRICKILYFADQEHLSRYGRSITGDTYIAMAYGPVPSKIEDIFKAVRGDSFFYEYADELRDYFEFTNKYYLNPKKEANLDYLSETDIECLDNSISKCKELSFNQLTELSHDIAWNSTRRDRAMSVKDILRETGDSDEYANYISEKLKLEKAFS